MSTAVRIDQMIRKRFNDGYYCKSIEEFEGESFFERFLQAGINWAFALSLPIVVIGREVAGSDWGRWAAVLGVGYMVWQVLVFLHELNENIRYVRHQLRVQRDAVAEVAAEIRKYKDPANFTLWDAVENLDSKWERP